MDRSTLVKHCREGAPSLKEQKEQATERLTYLTINLAGRRIPNTPKRPNTPENAGKPQEENLRG